jgi:hypothetical protein
MLAAAASISNKSEPFDPLSHINFSVETSIGDRLPSRTSNVDANNGAKLGYFLTPPEITAQSICPRQV